MLLLDSCQYQRRPGLIPNAWQSYPFALNCGFTGEMLPNQLRKVRQWMEEASAEIAFVFAAHHPFDSFAPRVRSSIGWLWREFDVGMLLSAHTHKGYFVHHDLGGEFDELELNLGSTTDWPMEWRTLRGFMDPTRKKIYVQAKRHTLVDTLRHESGYFLREWEIPLDAPDDYRKYKRDDPAHDLLIDFYLVHHLVPYWLPQPGVNANDSAKRTEEQVKDTMLHTYKRLLLWFPTDVTRGAPEWPGACTNDLAVVDKIMAASGLTDALERKVALLKELQAFERSRSSKDPETGEPNDDARLRWKLSQAAWASRFEAAQGRRLQVEDDLIRIDYDQAMRRRQSVGNGNGKN